MDEPDLLDLILFDGPASEKGIRSLEHIIHFLLSENAFWVAVSTFVSWRITHGYYKKSLSQQDKESARHINQLPGIVQETGARQGEVLELGRINGGVEEYKRRGTPGRVIDSYTDLPDERKEHARDRFELFPRRFPDEVAKVLEEDRRVVNSAFGRVPPRSASR